MLIVFIVVFITVLGVAIFTPSRLYLFALGLILAGIVIILLPVLGVK